MTITVPAGRHTIFALASGGGRAGVSVVRLSGPQSRFAVETIADSLPRPRYATLRHLKDSNAERLDQGLVLWFPGPASFTGEDCAEFHVHGSRAVIAALLATLGALDGLRPAEPGEFSRRAFLNGKMDLAQAEGLGDLIEAESEAQRRQALYQLDGALGRECAGWRMELMRLQALLEAELDFSDEGDVSSFDQKSFVDSVTKLKQQLEMALGGFAHSKRVRQGLMVVITGAPNAGKSSLLNYIAKRDVALVSQIAGTTRDLIEISVVFFGELVTFVDTAGIRANAEELEALGIARARSAISQADLVLCLSEDGSFEDDLTPAIPKILVATKSDFHPHKNSKANLRISTKTGAGMDQLFARLRQYLADLPRGSGLVTQERHAAALRSGISDLQRIVDAPNLNAIELVAEDLRLASQALAKLVGAFGAEDVLGSLFSSFCIGK